jgi:hypothetical protein
VGLTAGASAPDILVQQVIVRLRELGASASARWTAWSRRCTFPLPQGPGRPQHGRGRRLAILTVAAPAACMRLRTLPPAAPAMPDRTSQRTLTMLDINLLRRDLAAWSPALQRRKNPQPFLDVERYSALEAERKTLQTRTESCRPSATR